MFWNNVYNCTCSENGIAVQIRIAMNYRWLHAYYIISDKIFTMKSQESSDMDDEGDTSINNARLFEVCLDMIMYSILRLVADQSGDVRYDCILIACACIPA